MSGGGGIIYLNNSDNGINSGAQIPYSPDLPNLASCTADNYDSNNAWQITTVHDLNNLSTMSAADKTFEGKTVYVANDITYPENLPFTPIKKFSGIFDGMNHKISGINVSQTTASIITDLYGTIKNVTFENGLISGKECAGGIVYLVHGGSVVENCTNASKIELITSSTTTYVGGIIANVNYGYETPDIISVSNCVNLGEIHVENSRSYSSGYLCENIVGGIVGRHEGENQLCIDNCDNKGNITVNISGNHTYAGGISGKIGSRNLSSLINCHNSGSINAGSTGDGSVRIGGIAGICEAILDKCVNEGAVSGTSTYKGSTSYAAGISINGLATNCHNYGSVLASAGTYAYADGISYRSTIFPMINCSNHGDIKAVKTNNDSKYGSAEANGISAAAKYCYNLGDVSAISNVHGGYYKSNTYASGIAYDQAIGSFNAGTVIARGGDENVAGGISRGTTVNCSYNIGLVVAGDIGKSTIYPISQKFVNSYYLKGVVPDDATGVLTQEEMQSESFLDLLGREYYDTNRINFKADGTLYAYPVLAWQTYYANFVEFDTSGGSEIEAQYVTSGDVASEPGTPTKQNKVFWYWSKDGQEYDFDTVVSSDMKLTAEWYDRLMFISYPPQVV